MTTTITINGAELRECVRGLAKVIARNTSLPVLRCVLLQALNGRVSLTATNLDEYASYTFADARTDGNVSFLADIDHVKAVCGGDTASFKVGRRKVTAEFEKSGQRMSRAFQPEDERDFPALPPKPKTVEAKGWHSAYKNLLAFVSEEETRAPLQGVYTDIFEGKAAVVATDGRRMTCCELPLELKGKSFITPATKFLAQMKPEEAVRIGCTPEADEQRWVCVKTGSWAYYVRAINAVYPNYKQVIPPDGENRVYIAPEDDMPGLLKFLPGKKDDGIVLRRFRRSGLVVSVPKSADNGAESTVRTRASRFTGPDKAVMVRRDYLADALRAGFTNFSFVDSLTPLLCRRENALHVLMPMRMQSDCVRRAA